jgi:protein subunit release factor B
LNEIKDDDGIDFGPEIIEKVFFFKNKQTGMMRCLGSILPRIINRSFGSWSGILYKDTNLPSARIPIILKDNELEEHFVRGSGNGGQKINKNMSCVQLKHLPTGIIVETQRFRELVNNRREARKLLIEKLDVLYNGNQSKLSQKIQKIKKNISKRKARAAAKYGHGKKEDEGSQSEN